VCWRVHCYEPSPAAPRLIHYGAGVLKLPAPHVCHRCVMHLMVNTVSARKGAACPYCLAADHTPFVCATWIGGSDGLKCYARPRRAGPHHTQPETKAPEPQKSGAGTAALHCTATRNQPRRPVTKGWSGHLIPPDPVGRCNKPCANLSMRIRPSMSHTCEMVAPDVL
jgi:hypothetical protein